MHVFCLRRTSLKPRTFQQACRLASTRRRAVRPRSADLDAPSNSVHKGALDDADNDEDSIRWFEQDVETGVTRRVGGNPEELEAKELRRKIKALEAELKEYKSDDTDEALMAALKPEERAKVELALQKRKEREHEVTAGLELDVELPPLSVPLLKRLNASLRDAALHPFSVTHRKDLWRWYCRAKYSIPALPRMMPHRAWEVLWQTQAVESFTNPDRLQHTNYILQDMRSVGHPMTAQQRTAYIESFVELGDMDQAVQKWEESYETDELHPETLAQGISLYSRIGHLARAQELLREYLSKYPDKDPRPILLLISANTKSGNDHMAFALYLLLRQKLDSRMTMDDYDAVALQFLDADKKDLALAVFRDMMLQGNRAIKAGTFNQEARDRLYKDIFKRLDALRSSSTTATEVNRLSLVGLGALPTQWQNKYFYGSWLKKLIGLGQLDAANKVIELMYEREVEPDPKHMNGLIGAFMRTGDASYQAQGEALAWAMIQQRLDFTWRRRQAKRGEAPSAPPSAYESENGVKTPLHVGRPAPRATIETFNVLILHYVIKENWELARQLERMLRPAELTADTFFMNHMLQVDLFTKGPEVTWRQFTRLARAISPNVDTYNCLWTAELRHLHSNKDRAGFPLPRQLFAVMSTWLSSVDARALANAREAFSLELYAKVVQSFCNEKDFVGCLVAMHGMAKLFGMYPDHNIARIVTTAVSNIPEAKAPTIRGRRGRQQMPVSQSRLQNTTKVLAALAKRRTTAALEHGTDIAQLGPEARARENVDLLSEFIRVVLVRSSADVNAVEPTIERAAVEMNVAGIRTGDVDATNVS